MRINILGVGTDNVSFSEAAKIMRSLLLTGKKSYVVTPNPEFVVYAQKDPKFKEILNQADLSVPDGIGLIWGSKILGQPLKEKVAGVDLAEKAVEMAAELGKSVFFLGGRADSGSRAAAAMKVKYPGLRVAGTWSGDAEEDAAAIDKIGSGVGLLLVAFGHPKQEYWIERNIGKINVGVAMGVGGTFDFWSGKKDRAPVWVRNLGLEWLYRLIREPQRLRRQIALPKFVWLIFKKRLSL